MKNDLIELDLLESNELVFNVNVEGSRVAHKARLVLEGNDISYSFVGKPTTTKNNVSFLIPEGTMTEGMYPATIEVIVGNRYLVPLKFSAVFKGSVISTTKLVETKNNESIVECTAKLRTKQTLKDKWLKKNS